MDAYCILSATSLNQDGRSSSLTAPNGPAQSRVIRGALEDAALSPGDVSAFEMHGTGTGLGDPIEVGALGTVLQGVSTPRVLTAGKSLVGHAEPAAGMMGLAHIQTGMLHEALMPVLHLRSLNAHAVPILSKGKWSIQRSSGPHPASVEVAPFHTGTSSFAFQGTNAHSIIAKMNAAIGGASSSPLHVWEKGRHWAHVQIPAALCCAGWCSRRRAPLM